MHIFFRISISIIVTLGLISGCQPNTSESAAEYQHSQNGAFAANVSHSGQYAVVSSLYSGVSFWDLTNNQQKYTWYQTPKGENFSLFDDQNQSAQSDNNFVFASAISFDDSHAVLANQTDFTLWDIKTGANIGYWQVRTSKVKYRTKTINGADKQLSTYDVLDKNKCLDPQANNDEVCVIVGKIRAIDVSNQGKHILIGKSNGVVVHINTITGRRIEFLGHQQVLLDSENKPFHINNAINSVALSPNGLYALSGSSDETAYLWNTQTGQVIHKFQHHNRVIQVALDPKGKYAFTSDTGKQASIWDVRQSVNQTLNNLSKANPELEPITPHNLRHTAITALATQGAQAKDLQNFAGHNNYTTTTIYLHSDKDDLRAKLEASSRKKLSTFQKIKSQFLAKKETKIIHLVDYDNRFLIGREKEVKQINLLLSKSVSVILTGEIGTGKTQILESLRFDKKVFKIDDTKLLKKTVLAIILELYEGDKEAAKNLIYKDKEVSEISKLISKDSLTNLCKKLCEAVQKNEYILEVGEVDTITPVSIRALEILKTKFQIITTAREVKLKNASFLSDFEKVEIKNLDRIESIRLIRKLAAGLKIQNWEHFQNHIFNSSEGNPRIILELVERAKKEDYIDEVFVEEISSNYLGRTIKEIDVAFPLLAVTAVLLAFWIYSHSESINSMRVLRYALMVVVLFGRSILKLFRKNTI